MQLAGFSDKNVVEYYLDLLPFLNVPVEHKAVELFCDPEEKKWCEHFFQSHHIYGRTVISVAPCGGESFGPRADIKRWPLEKYAQLIMQLRKRYRAVIFLIAGPNEKDDIAALYRLLDCDADIYDGTNYSLPRIAALIERSDILISNDSAPCRFANALGVKMVLFFGPVDECVYGPYPLHDNRFIVLTEQVACRPCYQRFRLTEHACQKECLRSISVERAVDAVAILLKKVSN